MQERQDGRLALIALVLTLGLFVGLGVLARSFWVLITCFAGVVLLSGTGALAILLGSACAVTGILGPWFLHGSPPALSPWTARLAASGFDWGRGLAAVKAVLATRSLWGVLYVTVLCVLGTLLRKKRWDYLLTFGAILLAVGIGAGLDARVTPAVSHVLSSSPVVLMKDLLLTVGGRLGSPARGPLLAGLFLPVLLLPAILETLRVVRALGERNAVGRMLGSTLGAAAWRQAGGPSGLAVLAVVITRAVPAGLVIALWIALRQLAAAGQVIPFERIPDITLPHLRPIWHLSTLGIGLLVGVMNAGFVSMRRSRGQPGAMNGHPFIAFLAPLLLSLVTPAGVMIFVGAMCWTWQMETLVALVQMGPARGPAVHRKPPAPPASAPYIPTAVESEPVSPLPVEPSTLLFRHDAPIVDLVATESGRFVGIDRAGTLFGQRGKGTAEIALLDLASPLGLTALPGERVAVVERGGRILVASLAGSDPAPIQEIRTSGEILHHAFNGYGTIVAHADDTSRISLCVLSSGQERALADGLGTVSALAYSGDSTRLAVGTLEGDVHLIDMTTRRPVATLTPRLPPPVGVVALAEGPGPRWIVAHENGFLACWKGDGTFEQSQRMRDDVSRLAVDRSTGKIAFASEAGRLYVVSPDLRITFLVPETEQPDIVRVMIVEEGAALVSAGADGTVHRVEL